MPYIQLEDKQYPLRVGELRVGTDEGADIRLTEDYGSSGSAIVSVADDNHATIRRERSAGIVRVNGVQLGAEPTPLIHGDKIEIAGQEFLFGDDKKGGSTQLITSADIAEMALKRGRGPAKPTAATGGRLVSLVDGREYPVPSSGVVIGRDAACDIVVPSNEVSRRHAEVKPRDAGYMVIDISTNGVYVNGTRVQGEQLLGRGDVVRLGNEELRFYADTAKPAEAPAPSPQPVKATSIPAAPTPAPQPAKAAAAPSAEPSTAPAAVRTAPAPPAVPHSPALAPAAAAPAAMATASSRVLATLEIINEGVMRGRSFAIRSPLAHVGRGAHNDVVLDDESVSETHAKLQKRDGGWYVVDMGSTNGTYIAGKRILAEQELSGAPDVRFGGIKMLFRAEADAAEAAAKGTKMIAGVTTKQAQAMRASPQTPAAAVAPVAPAATKGGIPAWVWIVAAVVVLAALFFIMKGQ